MYLQRREYLENSFYLIEIFKRIKTSVSPSQALIQKGESTCSCSLETFQQGSFNNKKDYLEGD